MRKIRKGQKVSFWCSTYLKNGDCIDDGDQRPFQMIAGASSSKSELAKAISDSLIGMSIKEAKRFEIPARSAFGDRDEKKIFRIPYEASSSYQIKDEIQIRVGAETQGSQLLNGVIVDISNNHAYVDTNHPLAGEPLTINIQIISIDTK